MLNWIEQTVTVLRVNFQGLTQRLGLVLATTVSVALVVATLLGMVALNEGLKKTLANSGDPEVAMILRGGSQAEINSVVTGEQIDILENASETSAVSPEVNLIVDGYRKEDGERANISLRGLTNTGISLRKSISLTRGRLPNPGAPELAVGASIARDYEGMALGEQVEFGDAKWTIVGEFESGGGISESEVWGDLLAVQNLFKRANSVQSVRIQLENEQAFSSLSELNENDPRLKLSLRTEADYYAAQASRTSELAQSLAWPLAILMSIGAIIGAFNTMLSTIDSRVVEIATLRVLGYGRLPICLALLLESVFLCAIAGALGAVVVFLLLDGVSATTLGGGITRIGYSLQFTSAGFSQGIVLAATIGFLGALIPAIIASLRPPAVKLGQ
ncbi:MAG: ABC transporter permease [Verrucomicrobiota bacterium]